MGKSNNARELQREVAISGSNIAAYKAIAARRQEMVFTVDEIGGRGNAVRSVSGNVRNTISQNGEYRHTGITTDMAIKGSGMVGVLRNPNDANSKEIVWTRALSFRIDQNGDLVNSGGKALVAWSLDDNEQIPNDSSLLSSLTKVNFRNYVSKPVATSSVAVNMNLNAQTKALKGAGELLQLSRTGANANIKDTDIIIPEDTAISSLKQGDKLAFTSNPPGVTKTFEYGGIAATRAINVNNGMYGATAVGTNFTVTNTLPTPANQLQAGSGLTISLNGGPALNYVAAVNPSTARGDREFNSLQSLATAINNTDGLIANIKNDRLYIASTDGNASITFNNFNGSGIVQLFGLNDVAQVPANNDINRFATLQTLRQKINANNADTGLQAERNSSVNPAGSLDIHSLLATSSFNINGESFGVNRFSSVTTGVAYDVADGGADRGRATATISAPNHGLRSGDMIRITGVAVPGGTFTDGNYAVGSVNGDSFTIHSTDTPNNFPAAAAPVVTPLPNGGTWQKIYSQTYAPVGDAAITNVAVNTVTITKAGHTLANDDIIYVSGLGRKQFNPGGGGADSIIPDGYYTVQNANIAAGTFDITATGNAVHVAGVPPIGAFTYQKVGVQPQGGTIAAAPHIDSVIMQTIAGTTNVELFLSHHNYNVNDYIRFDNLDPAANNVTFGGITLTEGVLYQVVAIDNARNSVTFAAPQAAGVVAVAADISYAGNGNVPGANHRAIPALQVDNYSRTFAYLGLLQDTFTFNPTYDANDPKLSLSGNNQKYNDNRIFNHAFQVVDSLGIEHELTLKAAKLNNQVWSVELASVKDNNADDYDVLTNRADGLVANALFSFDAGGKLLAVGPGLDSPVSISWRNGSENSIIDFDFLGLLGQINGVTGGTSQTNQVGNSAGIMRNIEGNGYTAGDISDLAIDEEGFISASFTNGQVKNLFKIPIATFANIDGLEAIEGDCYRATKKSGAFILREAGTAGAGTIASKTVETSNVNLSQELQEAVENSQIHNAVLRTSGIELETIKQVLAEIRN